MEKLTSDVMMLGRQESVKQITFCNQILETKTYQLNGKKPR